MRRYRTRTTAWPAVADLMTALAVVGLACALIVADRPPPDWPDLRPEVASLRTEVASLETQNASLGAAVDSLERELAEKVIGFRPCWLNDSPPPLYFFSYNATVLGGRFSLAPHPHWAAGTDLRGTISPPLVGVLEDFPRGEVGGEDMVHFGERVNDALQAAGYPGDCELAVTVNTDITGNEILILGRAGFEPILR